MPAISRKVGTTAEFLPVFIPDATVSTGAGLANINASTMSLSWARNNMAAVSTQTCSTGTFGTWATSTVAQANSSLALGWYGVSIPDGVFASGRSAMVHLYGAPSMAPVPILVELTAAGWDNQSAVSTQAATMPVNLTQILGSTPVTTAAGVFSVNALTILGSTPVTSAAGVLSTDNRSIYSQPTITTAPGVQSVDMRTVLGSAPVTNSAGVFSVDLLTIYGTAPVTTQAGILASVFDLGRTANATSTVALTNTTISASQNVSTVTQKTGYALTAAYDPAKTAAQAGDAMTLTSGERNSAADALLARNVGGGSSAGRLVKEALYVLRNKTDIAAGTLTVYGTDDATPAFTATVSTTAGNPISQIDPA